MTKIELEIHDNLVAVINKIKNINDSGIELYIPKDALILENILNLKTIKNYFDTRNKTIHFYTEDPAGNNLLEEIYEETKEPNLAEESIPEEVPQIKKRAFPKIAIALPHFSKPKMSLLGIISLGAVTIIGFVALSIIIKMPHAYVKIAVNSQPLIKSVQIRVSANKATDYNKRILAGTIITVSDTVEKSIDTTGEKTIGEKAQGKVNVLNKTDEEKKFKKGTVFFTNDDKQYEFKLKDDVTIPAREAQTPDTETPEIITYKAGSKEAEIEAANIGKSYNIKKNTSLKIKDYSSNSFAATAVDDFSGGSEKKVKVVSAEDIDKLTAEATTEITKKLKDTLAKKSTTKEKIIKGTENARITNTAFSQRAGEEAEELKITITGEGKALAYSTSELDKIVDNLVEGLVPEGFVISNKERVLNVEILGSTAETVLGLNEADLQVTLKTFVILDIDETELKNDLAGKNPQQAEKVLGSIKNVKTYELSIRPGIPFLQNIPKDKERIYITIERDK